MPSSSRRLLQSNVHRSPPPDPSSAPLAVVDSDVVVILAALLCALISVVGLALVARCAWLRRSSSSSSPPLPPIPPPSKGIKKKALQSLPTVAFCAAGEVKTAECPICLAEFAEGEEIRILPRCGHGFHAACVDTWLGSHASCPSCRRTLVVPTATATAAAAASSRCRMCGANPEEAHQAAEATAVVVEAAVVVDVREEGSCGRFLP